MLKGRSARQKISVQPGTVQPGSRPAAESKFIGQDRPVTGPFASEGRNSGIKMSRMLPEKSRDTKTPELNSCAWKFVLFLIRHFHFRIVIGSMELYSMHDAGDFVCVELQSMRSACCPSGTRCFFLYRGSHWHYNKL